MNHLLQMGRQENLTFAYEKHHHTTWEITYYLEGTGINITNGIEYPFTPGTIVCQPPNLEHQDISENGYTNIYFNVSDFYLSSTAPIIAKDSDSQDFLVILKQLYQEYFSNNDPKIIDALLNVLYCYLSRRMESPCENPLVEKIKKEILFNFSNPNFQILKEINKLPISESQIRRTFKNETGLTPQQFLQSTRYLHAKRLLLDETLSINQVCYLCGFTDPFYFSRIFKKMAKVSPRVWRKLNSAAFPATDDPFLDK